MYSSLYGQQSNLSKNRMASNERKENGSQRGSHRGGSKLRSKISTVSDPLSLNALDVNVRPLLNLTEKLLNGRLTVRIIKYSYGVSYRLRKYSMKERSWCIAKYSRTICF